MTATPPVSDRDLRIDFLRGLFVVGLSATHYSWFASVAGYTSVLRFYDIQPFGFSSPAEFFVFFSGYILALVLGRSFAKSGFWLTQARTVHRAWTLYVLNVFTLAIIAGSAVFLFSRAPVLVEVSGIDRFLGDPARFFFKFLTFRANFAFFEILRNYIFFIPLIAIYLRLSRIHVAIPLGVSFAVWVAHQFSLIPGYPYVTFNPFAWQFIFFLGASIAQIKPLTEWRFPRRGLQIAIFAGLVLLAFAVKMTVFAGIQGEDIPFAEKTDVGPMRIVHFLLLLWGALLLTPASPVLARSKLAMAVVAVGQNSLECFCLTNVLVYFGADLLTRDVQSVPHYFAILLAIITLVLLGGRVFAWFKSTPWRQKGRGASPSRDAFARELGPDAQHGHQHQKG